MRKDTTGRGGRATSTGQQGTNGAVNALGINTKYASTQATPDVAAAAWNRAQLVQARYGTQNRAAKLLPRERVALCMRQIRRGVDAVSVLYAPNTQTAHYGGLVTCGSVWTCPVCAAKITERRRTELAGAIVKARAAHLRVVMLTYTFSHHRGDHLPTMLDMMRKAFKRYHSGRAAVALRERFAVVGTVRALEVMHSEVNGWHPHIHELVFLPDDVDVEAFGRACRSAWERAAAAFGLQMNAHGFKLDDCDARIADYLAKFGHEPRWQEDRELTKWHVKKGRGSARGADEHVTPFGLLDYANQGDERAGALFVEYARAFKGLRQLHWSRGLRELLDMGIEKTDEELIEEQEEEAVVLVQLNHVQWRAVVGNDARAELLEVAATGDVDQVRDFLSELGICLVLADS